MMDKPNRKPRRTIDTQAARMTCTDRDPAAFKVRPTPRGCDDVRRPMTIMRPTAAGRRTQTRRRYPPKPRYLVRSSLEGIDFEGITAEHRDR